MNQKYFLTMHDSVVAEIKINHLHLFEYIFIHTEVNKLFKDKLLI